MKYSKEVEKIHTELHEKKDDENEFLGWLELPTKYNKKEFKKIKECAKKIQANSDVLLVIGIGGSYLGARAVIEALTNTFYNLQDKEERKTPQIIYVGNNLSPNYMSELIDLISNKDFSINVITKLNNQIAEKEKQNSVIYKAAHYRTGRKKQRKSNKRDKQNTYLQKRRKNAACADGAPGQHAVARRKNAE